MESIVLSNQGFAELFAFKGLYQFYLSATHRAQTRATARARIRASAIRR